MIRNERLTSTLEGEFVVFLIGLRINEPLKVHTWWPVTKAMPRMLKELHRHPELGFLHAETWFARTTIMVQYWRSMDQLLAYAKNKTAEHLPAWQAFNQAIGTDGSVGIWHETYAVSRGSYENVYVNMPAFGLGKVGSLASASGERKSAAGRLGATGKVPRPQESVMKRTWTIIGVADVAASVRWYQSLLGIPPTTPAHDYFAQILDTDGTVLLCLHAWGAHDHPSLTRPDSATPGNGLLLFFASTISPTR